MIEIREANTLSQAEYDQLAELLVAVVDDGASIGFLPPLAPAEADAYWRGVLGPNTVLLLAEEDGAIIGSAQLHLEPRANGNHRAEVAKVMVSPKARRRGLGRALMVRLEDVARRDGRSLLVLDTRDGDPSNDLYRSMGYLDVGKIPGYARSAGGSLHATVFYYKTLA
ncbi:MAG: GNAT family N-acetyltransferase [Chloroflexi bacterium]|nr:GNAT family N-acetyltransferase [Chloroflexota bacterium]